MLTYRSGDALKKYEQIVPISKDYIKTTKIMGKYEEKEIEEKYCRTA